MVKFWLTLLLLAAPLLAQNGSSSFDGTDFYPCGDLDIATNITIAAWVCPTDAGATREDVIVKQGTGGTTATAHNYRLVLFGSGAGTFTVRFEFRDAANVAYSWRSDSAQSVPVATDCSQPRQWTHIAATYNTVAAPIFYVNGAVSATTQVTGAGVATMASNNLQTYIGGQEVGTEQYHGRIAYAVVGQYIASAGEVNAMYINPMRTRGGGTTNHIWPLWAKEGSAASHNYGNNNAHAQDCGDPTGTANDPTLSVNGPPVRAAG